MEFNLQRTLSSGKIQTYELSGDRVTIGRDPNNDLSVDETVISARHAILTKGKAGLLLLEDCASSNGTFVNNASVKGALNPVKLGDVIRFGNVDLVVVEKPPPNAISVVPLSQRKKDTGKN